MKDDRPISPRRADRSGLLRRAASGVRKHPVKVFTGLVIAGLLGWLVYLGGEGWDTDALIAVGKGLPAWALAGGFVVLPLVGVPISLFLVVIGIRFGFAGGMLLAVLGISFHNFVAYRVAHGLFRDRVRHWLEAKGYAIPPVPEKHRVWFTAVFAAVHGPPYAAKIYLLALTDIPLRIYLGVGAPVYAAFCILPIGFGHAFTDMHFGWIMVIATILIGTVALGHWLKGKLGDESK
jgi:uncharacterized membrane protein YdjX (TVP38/TMEM64 family)